MQREGILSLQIALVEIIVIAMVIGVLANYASDSLVAMGAPLGPSGLFLAFCGIIVATLVFIRYVPIPWTTTGLSRRIYSKKHWRVPWDAFRNQFAERLKESGIAIKNISGRENKTRIRIGLFSEIAFELHWKTLKTQNELAYVAEFSITPEHATLLDPRASQQIAVVANILREFEYGFTPDLVGELLDSG